MQDEPSFNQHSLELLIHAYRTRDDHIDDIIHSLTAHSDSDSDSDSDSGSDSFGRPRKANNPSARSLSLSLSRSVGRCSLRITYNIVCSTSS